MNRALLPSPTRVSRPYIITMGYGRFASRQTVNVDCVEQRGQFYASLNTLNASPMGVGDTRDAAYDAWAKRWNAVPVQVEAVRELVVA